MQRLDLQQQNFDEQRLGFVRFLQEASESSQNISVELLEDPETNLFWVRKTEVLSQVSEQDSYNVKSVNIKFVQSLDSKYPEMLVTREIIIGEEILKRAQLLGINPFEENIIPTLFYRVEPEDDNFKIISYTPFINQDTLYRRLIDWNIMETKHLIQIFRDLAKKLDVLVSKFHVVPDDLHWKNVLVTEKLETFVIDFGKYDLLSDFEFQGSIVSVFLNFIETFIKRLELIYIAREKQWKQKYLSEMPEITKVINEDNARLACNRIWMEFYEAAQKQIDTEHWENNLSISQVVERWIHYLEELDQITES